MLRLLVLLLILFANTAIAQGRTFILGDSIAKGDCCLTSGPSSYLPKARNLAVNGNRIVYVTQLLGQLHSGQAWVHVGVNDAATDNPDAERDMAQMLDVMRQHKKMLFVVDKIGPLGVYTWPSREAIRDRLNAMLDANTAVNIVVIPFVVTSFSDGEHPDALGYAQQMPLVLTAFAFAQPLAGYPEAGTGEDFALPPGTPIYIVASLYVGHAPGTVSATLTPG